MQLIIKPQWETLDDGPLEEQACFAAVEILAGGTSLTTVEDRLAGCQRSHVHLSAYHLAEWFAWNWWRQRWESRTKAPDWEMAHHMSTIGQGYVWPNITIHSDGEQISLNAKSTKRREHEPIRYLGLGDSPAEFQATEFEQAVSSFVEKVLEQLRKEEIAETNLDRIWADVCAERSDPEATKRREFEALLGQEPDEAEEGLLDQLVAQEGILGENAVHELAASSSAPNQVLMSEHIAEFAATAGYDTCPRDAVYLEGVSPPQRNSGVPAWRQGVFAAKKLRAQEHLGVNPISNQQLAQMAGVDEAALARQEVGVDQLSFLLDDNADAGRVVLRTKSETGRRFELGRLLGDRIAGTRNERLFPATRPYTYRQKLQRAFSAEFLAPFNAVDEMLGGDFGGKAQQKVADHFNISSYAIRTALVNNDRIERAKLDRANEIGTYSRSLF